MTSNKKIHILYWVLPILFILWEIFISVLKMPLLRDLFPQFIRDGLLAPPQSLAEVIAEQVFLPTVLVLYIIWKYFYITVCYFLRKCPVVVLIFTIILIVICAGVYYAVYLPLDRPANISVEDYQWKLFCFFGNILAYCPFYLCVYFLIKRMCKLDLTNKSEKETISQGEIS